MQVKEDSHATENRNRQRKINKIQLTRIVKIIGPNWRARCENQSYGLGFSIRRVERKNSLREVREL